MTKTIFAFCVASLALGDARAQDCAKFLFLQKGKTVEMTIYDKKGGPNGRQVYTVNDVSNGGGTTTGTLNSEMFDKNGNSKAKATSIIMCSGGEMHFDMKLYLPPQQTEQVGNKMQANVNAQTSFLNYPGNMKVGDNLPDGNFSMDLANSAPPPPGGGPGGPPPPPFGARTVTIVISNRHVEAQESVTTSAGTWDCFRISYKSKVSVKTGPLGFPVNIEGTEWYAPGFGIVKTQSKYGGTAITSIK